MPTVAPKTPLRRLANALGLPADLPLQRLVIDCEGGLVPRVYFVALGFPDRVKALAAELAGPAGAAAGAEVVSCQALGVNDCGTVIHVPVGAPTLIPLDPTDPDAAGRLLAEAVVGKIDGADRSD